MTSQTCTPVGRFPRRRLRWARWCLLALLGSGLAAGLHAATGDDFMCRTWTVDDGLPNDSVTRLVFDPRGLLWVATGSGLARFDGREFREYPLPVDRPVGSHNIREIAAHAGGLVALPAEGGLVEDRGAGFRRHPAADALVGQTGLDLHVELNGTVWVATQANRILRWEDGKAQWFGAEVGMNRRGSGMTVASDGHGVTWVCAYDFIGSYRDGRLERYAGITGTGLVVAPARDRGVWVANRTQLMKLRDGAVTPVCSGEIWRIAEGGGVQTLHEDATGAVWIGTRRQGLFRFAHGTITAVPLPHDAVHSIVEDRQGNLWVGAGGGGLHRLRTRPVTMVGTTVGLDDNVSTAVCEDEAGVLWCANRVGGLVRLVNGVAEKIQPPRSRIVPYVVSVCPDREGSIWVGASQGLYRVPPGARQLELVSRTFRNVHVLFCARDGTLWVGYTDQGGLAMRRGGEFAPITFPEGVTPGRVKGLAEDSHGRIWIIANGRQLCVWEAGAVRRAAEVPGGVMSALYADETDNLWIATSDGLVLRRGEASFVFTTEHGLPDNQIEQVLEDNHGRLWCGTRRGMFCVAREELLAVAAGRVTRVRAALVGHEQGLRGTASLTGGQPMTWRGRDGRLWFATHGGIVGLEPVDALPTPEPPPLYIDEVLVDRKPVRETRGVSLAPGVRELDVKLLLPEYTAPESVRLRHRLVGFDYDWVETPLNRRATYAGLAPGRYTFVAEAVHSAGVWKAGPVTLAVRVIPAWWQVWWVRLGGFLAFSALMIWAARVWSHRRLKARLDRLEREHMLEKERARIARNLHDDLGGSLTQIGLLAERVKRHAADPSLQSAVSQLAGQTRRLAGELESIVWTVNPTNDTWDRLAGFIDRFAKEFCHQGGLECTVSGVPTVPSAPLPPEAQHGILAVVKEALNNVLKHARASRVDLALSVVSGAVELRIVDDGRGFEPDAPEHAERNGLTNMRTRMRDIGGEIRIESRPGGGTVITVRQPLAASARQNRSTPS